MEEKCRLSLTDDVYWGLYDGEYEALSTPPYVSYLMEALRDPKSDEAELLEGYESNLLWDSIVQTEKLSEEVIVRYIKYMDLDLLKKHQVLTDKVITTINALRCIEKEKASWQKYFKVDTPVFVVTKPGSVVKKITDQSFDACKDAIDVIGRVYSADDTTIFLDNSRQFRSIIYKIPIDSILSIGYICDRPEVETVRDQLVQYEKGNCFKTFLIRDDQLTVDELDAADIEVDEEESTYRYNNKRYLVLTEQETRQYATEYIKTNIWSDKYNVLAPDGKVIDIDGFVKDLIASFGYDSYINDGCCKEHRVGDYFIYELKKA